jgi:AraC-like DNA-binding protein
VTDAFGVLDVLVHVVGVPAIARCGDVDLLEWKRLLASELDCAFVTTRAAVRQMHRQGGGSIIYVGSTPSMDALGLVALYARLRRGLTALATAVARDGGAPGVRAKAIWSVFASRPVARDVVEAATSPARAAAPSADAEVDRVCDLATALLPMGLCTLERVARHLGVDPRTLQRRLARQETSFGAIVDDLRAEQAARFLRTTDLSLTEMAETLGFSALSAFSRWFRQRFGCSATSWRRVELMRLAG